MVSIKELTYKNFGKCLSISNGVIELFVTVDIGPRIIKCNYIGKNNLMFEDIERKCSEDVSSLYGEGKRWFIYGGHRLWTSPESMPKTYYPDNEKVVYTTFASGAEFIPNIQSVTGLQYSIKVEMDNENPNVKITHKIKNNAKSTFNGSAWALSVMDSKGTVVIPQPQEDTGLLGNRILALWPYTKMTDSRVFWGDKYIALTQNPEIDEKFKLGINNTKGKIAYINHGQALVKDYGPHDMMQMYPDFGVSTETFTNNLFVEFETLSPLTELKSGASLKHTEQWELFDNVTLGNPTNETLEQIGSILFN